MSKKLKFPHLAVNIPELTDAVGERDHLRGADEREVQRIEVDDHVLSLIVGEGDLFELSVHNGLSGEGGCGFLHLSSPGSGAHTQAPGLGSQVGVISINRATRREVIVGGQSYGWRLPKY